MRKGVFLILLCSLLILLIGSCKEFNPFKPQSKDYYIQYVIEGSIVDVVTVEEDSLVPVPKQRTKNGYFFDGWYKDSEYLEKWDFEKDRVDGNTNLYGRWILNGTRFENGDDYFIWGGEDYHLVEYSISGQKTTTTWGIDMSIYYIGGSTHVNPIHVVGESGYGAVFTSYEDLISQDRIYFYLAYGVFTRVDE